MIFINLHKEANGPHLGDGETFATLESARQNAAYFDDYICTLELTDDGQFVKRHADTAALDMIRCERKFSPFSPECGCGHHSVMGIETDIGIYQPYLEG